MRLVTSTLLFAFTCSAIVLADVELPKQRSGSYPPELPGAVEQTYKQIGDVELKLHVYLPQAAEAKRPAILFFFGGGWKGGSPAQFEYQCRYLASRGLVAVTADYRVSSRQNVKAVDCVRDAADAIRYVRKNAAKLGVDPDKIISAGGSAGGHLAACLGTLAEIPGDDGPHRDLSFRPNAMVLFNPALHFGDGVGLNLTSERTGVDPLTISPFHHISDKTPPTLLLFGTDDNMTDSAKAFAEKTQKAGGRCELEIYPGQAHGFFNVGRDENKMFRATLERADKFLESLGYVNGSPQVATFFRN